MYIYTLYYKVWCYYYNIIIILFLVRSIALGGIIMVIFFVHHFCGVTRVNPYLLIGVWCFVGYQTLVHLPFGGCDRGWPSVSPTTNQCGFNSTLYTFTLHLGCYPYTEDLVQLDSCRPKPRRWSVEERLSGVFTPLNLPQWESMLKYHRDSQYVDFILNGIKDGFRVGYHRSSESKQTLSSARKKKKYEVSRG